MARKAELVLEVELVDTNDSGFGRFSSLLVDLCKAAQLERREEVPVAALSPATSKGYRRIVTLEYNESLDERDTDSDPAVLAERFMAEHSRDGSVLYKLSRKVTYAASEDPVAA